MLPCNLSVSLKFLHISCSQLLVWHLLHVCTFFTTPGVSRLVLPCTSEQTQAPFCNNDTFSVRHFWITTFKIINREGLGLQKKNKIIKIINTLFSTLVFPGYPFLRSTVFFYASFYFIFNASFPFYLLTYQLI